MGGNSGGRIRRGLGRKDGREREEERSAGGTGGRSATEEAGRDRGRKAFPRNANEGPAAQNVHGPWSGCPTPKPT
eukprot:7405192-Pyramimonas_sp.AAC.1